MFGPGGSPEEYAVAREKNIIIVILKYNIIFLLFSFQNTANTFLLEYISILGFSLPTIVIFPSLKCSKEAALVKEYYMTS